MRARLLYGAATFALAQGDLDRATEAGRECIAVSRGYGDDRAAGWGLACQGLAAWARGDYDSGWTLTEQAVAAARRAGDRWDAAMGLAHLGRVATDQGDVERAEALLEESVALARDVSQPMAVGFALDLLATLAYRDGRDAPAAALAEQALWAYRAGGSPQELIGSALRTIGLVAFAAVTTSARPRSTSNASRCTAVSASAALLPRVWRTSPTLPPPGTNWSRQLISSRRRTPCAV
ncbi:MAG: hypothetical protein LC799_23855 [Actinobacteria bacterium]|nr:hypothetical protein [Actinomycetota bacterium]